MVDVQVRVIEDAAACDVPRREWTDLLTRSADASPYVSSDWATAWMFANPRVLPHIVCVRRAQRLIGVAPLVIRRHPVMPGSSVVEGLRQLRADFAGTLLGDSPADAVNAFHRLNDLRWSGKQATAVGPFTTAGGRRLLMNLAARGGPIRISTGFVDDMPIAARFGALLNGTDFGVKSAFDPESSKYGPGHLITGLVLRTLIDMGIRRVEFMRGEADHKAAWTADSHAVAYWTAQSPRPGGRAGGDLVWRAFIAQNWAAGQRARGGSLVSRQSTRGQS